MLKNLFRIGMILLAAGLVVGALFLYAGSGLAGTPGSEERPQMASSDGVTTADAASGEASVSSDRPERPGEGGEGEDGSSIYKLVGVLGQLGKIGLITLNVVGIQALFRMIQGRNRPTKTPSPEAM